jgi:hypothetical protein
MTLQRFLILGALFTGGLSLSWLLHQLLDLFDQRPALDSAYAQFRLFLLRIRAFTVLQHVE